MYIYIYIFMCIYIYINTEKTSLYTFPNCIGYLLITFMSYEQVVVRPAVSVAE